MVCQKRLGSGLTMKRGIRALCLFKLSSANHELEIWNSKVHGLSFPNIIRPLPGKDCQNVVISSYFQFGFVLIEMFSYIGMNTLYWKDSKTNITFLWFLLIESQVSMMPRLVAGECAACGCRQHDNIAPDAAGPFGWA